MPSPKYKAANGKRYLIEPVPDIITGETIGYRASGPDGLECHEEGDPAWLSSTQPKRPQKPIWTRCRAKRKNPHRYSPVGVLL